jgi:4-amino-4-deoxychorismate lyase
LDAQPVFIEVIKSDGGAYLNLEGHAVRMDRTMRRFFRQPFVQPTLARHLPAPPSRGVAKLTVLYSDIIISAEFSDYEKPQIRSLAMVDAGQVDYIFKSRDRERLNEIKVFSGADEAVIVRNGFITNVTTANLVFRDTSGNLFTPLHYIHSGTKREFYIRTKTVTAYPIKHDQLSFYESVTLVNAMLDIEDDVTFPCSLIKPVAAMPFQDAPEPRPPDFP